MQFRIADTFTASLARLPSEQQKAAKATAFDLQTNLPHPGLSLHRLTGTKDLNFWSVRVSQDLRIILHRNGETVVLWSNATWTATMTPTVGPSAADWKPIPRPALPSWLSCGR